MTDMLCEACGSRSFKRAGSVPDLRFQSASVPFDIVHCEDCGLVRTAADGKPYDPSPYYGEHYGAFAKRALPYAPRSAADLESTMDTFLLRLGVARQRLSVLRNVTITSETAVLDVGCGCGEIAKAIEQQYGCTVRGIEPNPGAAAEARSQGIEVFVGRAEQYRPESSVDLALMIHSLEHLTNPAAALTTIRDALRPGGTLVVAVPNYRSVERVLFGRYWDGWDVPRHVHHYTPQTLATLLERTGFAPRMTCYELYSVLGRSLGNLLHTTPYEERKKRIRLGKLESAWGLAQALTHVSSAMIMLADRN